MTVPTRTDVRSVTLRMVPWICDVVSAEVTLAVKTAMVTTDATIHMVAIARPRTVRGPCSAWDRCVIASVDQWSWRAGWGDRRAL